ncbi:hypothetical protein ACFWN1_30125 [Streptomyces sp. NPDC058459]|uniref:hypothetical protein n=1 Tax=Streptomyces sp. NPDC058459 TaxID=3346508 RepID=UPI00365C28C5
MTDPNVVSGTVVPEPRLDGSNVRGYRAQLRALAVTLHLGPLVVLAVLAVLQGSGWSAAACAAFATAAAASARSSRLEFLWARLD